MVEIGGWKLDLGGWRGRQGGGSHASNPRSTQRIGLLVPKKNLPKEEEEEEEEGFESLEVWSLEEGGFVISPYTPQRPPQAPARWRIYIYVYIIYIYICIVFCFVDLYGLRYFSISS